MSIPYPNSWTARTRIGITGTNTNVGKTVVTSALLAALRDLDVRVGVMKPVETGESTDAATLRRVSGNVHALDMVRPYAFPDPAAPLVAARRANAAIDMRALDDSFRMIDATSDAVLVEGAGGLLVPITEVHNFATLFERWSLDVIVVAENRLGVINHTLLTVHAAHAHRLTIRAIVLTTITQDTPTDVPTVAEETNQALLAELLPGIPIIPFPYLEDLNDLEALAVAARPILAHLSPAAGTVPLTLATVPAAAAAH